MKKVLAALVLALVGFLATPATSQAAVSMVVNQKSTSGKYMVVVGTLTFSGSYTTGGDTLTLSGYQVPGTQPPRAVFIQGSSGFPYQWVPGTTRANGKIKVLTATTTGTNLPLAEHSQVAYVAGVTGDTVTILILFDSLR